MKRSLPDPAASRRRALAAGAALLAGALGAARAQTPREIAITAQRFRFTPGEIALSRGERVALLLRTLDFGHGFSVPQLGLRADFVPERVVRVELQAGDPGIIEFLCDNFCGAGHEQMHGRFVVGA
ncbi:MAG: cupredoxin domain-containing protein [Burkholderiales bacterium]|nr:cupredoxin domain-containing protein [Burkholderiales bacterium]